MQHALRRPINPWLLLDILFAHLFQDTLHFIYQVALGYPK